MLDYLNNELFEGIEAQSFLKMMKCCNAQKRIYDIDSCIFSQENRPHHLYILNHGKVNIQRTFPSGKRSILYQVYENEVFGDNFLSSEENTYPYEAIALENSEILILPYSFIYNPCTHACDHHRKVIYNLLNIQSKNNLRMLTKLQIISNTTIRQKVALWLFERYKNSKTIPFHMNREELAEYLGVTRPSLSRTLMEMQKLGWIKIQGKQISILNIEGLETLFDD